MSIKIRNFILYFIALTFMGLGIALYLRANIGVGAWDVLHNNLTENYFNLTFGTWVFIVGFISVTISQLLSFNLKNYFAVITGLINGKIIDLFYYKVLIFELNNIYIQILYFTLSLILLGSGISLLVLTKFPPTPADVLMLGLVKKYDFNYVKAKTITELSVLFVAIFISIIVGKPFSNIGIGTIITTFLIGVIIGYTSKKWRKLLKM